MKNLIRVTTTALFLFMMTLSNSWADEMQDKLRASVEDAAFGCSTGNIQVVLDEDGVATLSGRLDCQIGKDAAERAAKASPDVKKVVNLILID